MVTLVSLWEMVIIFFFGRAYGWGECLLENASLDYLLGGGLGVGGVGCLRGKMIC